MVHLEQMNKRLDMLEKTCVSLIEKNSGAGTAPVVCPYHAQQMTAQQHLDKRIQHDMQQEMEAAATEHRTGRSDVLHSQKTRTSAATALQRRAAM